MKIPRPLFWHQGIFLQPQHFQLQDQVTQSGLLPFLKYQQPHFWGVGEVDIDKSALAAGVFNLVSGNFLFPDGSYLQLPGNALVEPRRLDGGLPEGKPLLAYLGLRKWNESGANVTVLDRLDDLGLARTRFVTAADPEEVRDLHGGGADGQVKRLYYLLRVFWEVELGELADYHLIPLARLEQFGTDIRLSPRFVPPSLALEASEPLIRQVREIRDQLAARSHQLEQYKRQRGVQSAEFGSRDMVYLLALRTLNRNVPLLFHLTETSPVHPWAVYGVLRQLIGELSSFSLRVNLTGELDSGHCPLPLYDHCKLWDCFSGAQDLVTQLLDEITAGPDYVIRLAYDGTFFATDLKPAVLEEGSRYFLALKTESDHQVVLRSLEAVAKLSTREHLPVLASRALPGLDLEYLHIPPQELPRRARTLYFAVNHHHDQWRMVEKDYNIALYWDSAPADLEVDLMVVEKLPAQLDGTP
jgi:type VI secretion system protein ImpJ